MEYRTEQEKFWSEEFGEEYIKRNNNVNNNANNIALFTKILSKTDSVKSVIEFGANIGLNLQAIHSLLPLAEYSALEINKKAVTELKQYSWIKNVYSQSIYDFQIDYQRDFTLIKGVLIHINPSYLSDVYEILYKTSKRYICIAEYYNPTPVEVDYRGHKEKLFKRDFCGEFLNKYNNVRLVDYGFVYHKDNYFPQDDITWFLLEKK